MHRIVPLSTANAEEVAQVLASSFAVGTHAAGMLPESDPAAAERRLLRLFRHLTQHEYADDGRSEVALDAETGAVLGAALWEPPRQRRAFWREFLGAATYLRVFGTRILDALRSAVETEQARPDDEHWYLRILGTVPAAQGQGVGTELLERGMRQADAAGQGMYLEASTRRNVPYYARFGFQEQRELGGYGTAPAIAMWRPASRPHPEPESERER